MAALTVIDGATAVTLAARAAPWRRELAFGYGSYEAR